MAVQAQYPSNALLTDYRKRARQLPVANAANEFNWSPGSSIALLGSAEDPQPIASNFLRFYNSAPGMNMIPHLAMNLNEADNNEVMGASRKRAREDEEFLLARHQQQQQSAFLPLSCYQQNSGAGPFGISRLPISTGLRLAFDEARLTPLSTVTSSSEQRGGSCLSSILGDELQAHYIKQKEEIDQLIQIQGEQMKHLLEERRQRYTRAMLALMEEGLCRRLKEKDEEVERVNRRNVELEERVKQLSIESQLWQNLAWNNEAMMPSLRSSLEQVVAQSREQSRAGRAGESSEADDAQSSNQVGEMGGEDDTLHHAHALTASMRENKGLQPQRACRVCQANSVCILILPCRHLCLCRDCDVQRAHCPICQSPKNASVQVYMD